MVVTRNGTSCARLAATLLLMGLLYRFALPIGAVDTHRPKPSGGPAVVAPSGSGREYFDEPKAGTT
jgi:hypothetical protein